MILDFTKDKKLSNMAVETLEGLKYCLTYDCIKKYFKKLLHAYAEKYPEIYDATPWFDDIEIGVTGYKKGYKYIHIYNNAGYISCKIKYR